MGNSFDVNMNEYLPLRDVVFNTLRQAILKGELAPGERLMEIQLAEKLGVSRTPIREAIRKLELEGLVLMIPRKTRRVGFAALLSVGIGALITNVCLKNIVARPRPYDACAAIIPLVKKLSDYSFPSGHTCASFASAFIYFRMLPRKYGITAMILAVLISFSRLYLGVHYPTDVLGGFLVGLAASILAVALVKRYWKVKETI